MNTLRILLILVVTAGNLLAQGTLVSDLTVQKKVILTGDVAPTQLSANTNDYAPTNFANYSVFYLTSDAARDITGLAGGTDGRVIYFVNRNLSAAITLKANSSSSLAVNRFGFPADYVLRAAGGSVALIYDSTASLWRLAGSEAVSGVYEPVITAGTSAQYWRGDKSWQTLNQAAVAGLTTADSPTFTGLNLSGTSMAVPDAWVLTSAGSVDIVAGGTNKTINLIPTGNGTVQINRTGYTGGDIPGFRIRNSAATDGSGFGMTGTSVTSAVPWINGQSNLTHVYAPTNFRFGVSTGASAYVEFNGTTLTVGPTGSTSFSFLGGGTIAGATTQTGLLTSASGIRITAGTPISETSSGALSLKLGYLTASPSNSTDAFIAVHNSGGPGALAGDLLYITRTSNGVANAHRWFTGVSGTLTQQMILNNTGELQIGSTTDAGAYVLQVTGASYLNGTVQFGASTSATIVGNASGNLQLTSASGQNISLTPGGNGSVSVGGTLGSLKALSSNGIFGEVYGGGSVTQSARIGVSRVLNFGDAMFSQNLTGVSGADTYQTNTTANYAAMEFFYVNASTKGVRWIVSPSTQTAATPFTPTYTMTLGDGGKLSVSPFAYSQPSWTTTGALLALAATTVTNNTTGPSGTAASAVFYSFAAPTLAATNTSVTTNVAATLYIGGDVIQGTNQNLPATYGLWNAGKTRFDGALTATSATFSGPLIQVSNSVAAGARGIGIQTSGSQRWQIYANGTTESGSNAGSDFVISAYTDAGAFLSSPLTITRSTSNANFLADVTVSGGDVFGATTLTLNTGGASGSGVFINTLGVQRAFFNATTPAVGTTWADLFSVGHPSGGRLRVTATSGGDLFLHTNWVTWDQTTDNRWEWASTTTVGAAAIQMGTGSLGELKLLVKNNASVTAGNAVSFADALIVRESSVILAGTIVKPGGTSPLVSTNTAITDGAGASTATLTNAPAVGNPTKWVRIDDNGTTRYIPAW